MQPIRSRLSFLLLLLACLCATPAALAEEQQADSYEPRTGDAWIDRHLADINVYAARYPQSFIDEVARYHAVPRAYVESLLQQPGWQAGDVLMACALAQQLALPCRRIVREWSRDHAQGWAEVAARLQSKPDASDYRALREDIRQSYSRWARPLPK